MMTRLRAGSPMKRCSIPGECKDLIYVPNLSGNSGVPQAFFSVDTEGFFFGGKAARA